MRPLLIGLHGKARSGKDSVGRILHREYGCELYAFAGPLKRGLDVMLNLPPGVWDSDAKEHPLPWLGKSPRQLAQTLGTEWGRNLVDPSLWSKLMLRRWEHVKTLDPPYLCVTDVRFNDEAELIKAQGGQVVHIIRPGQSAVAHHVSEQGVDDRYVDHWLTNAGTLEDLARTVRGLARLLSL